MVEMLGEELVWVVAEARFSKPAVTTIDAAVGKHPLSVLQLVSVSELVRSEYMQLPYVPPAVV